MSRLRIAVIQGVCYPFRARFFGELAKVEKMKFTFVFGKAPNYLKHQAFSRPEEISMFRFNYQFLPSISYQGKIPTPPFHWKRSLKMFPTLTFRMLKGKYDVIIVDGALFLDLPLLLLGCKLTQTPIIVWSGGNIKDNLPKSTDPLIKKIVYVFVRFVYRRCNAAIAYGTGTKEFLTFLGMNPNRIFVAPNTVDNFFFEKIPKMNRERMKTLQKELGLGNEKVILYVGTLEKRKNLDTLIMAFEGIKATLPKTSLLIVGDGPDKERLVELCNKRNLGDSVKFKGKVDYSDLPFYYSLCNVFVLPSQGGITVMEAIASGKPVIVSEECNALYSVPGIVRHKENGFIVKKGDFNEIKNHLYHLLTNDDVALEMGRKAKEIASKLFSIDKMIQGFLEAIKYALSTKLRT